MLSNSDCLEHVRIYTQGTEEIIKYEVLYFRRRSLLPDPPPRLSLAATNMDLDEPYATSVNAAKAFQYMATIFVSVILVLVVVAAFMAAPITGRLGLGAGIALAVFAVFQLIAFALMAAFVEERETHMTFFR